MVDRLSTRGSCFVDSTGRQVLLRGVNLGGDCKVPTAPDGHTRHPTDFSDHRTVSFVGRPFPLEEADAHLARIAGWGFNCLRLLTTWEAVEHAGPGEYDEEYLDYFAAVCDRAGAHGLHVFIDFHQDVWSRMSGGDGAPGWTFEAVGLDFTRFHAAGAAHVMQYRYDPSIGGRQDAYPQMSWATNYRMPPNGFMWTLFFGGEAFAPDFRIDGINAGRWLRDRYLGAVRQVAERIAHLDHVVGFDSLNEPGSGWIGRALDDPGRTLSGAAWTPLDGLAVASGVTRVLPVHAFGRGVVSRTPVNADGVSIWLPGREDPFRVAGVWDIDLEGAAVALRPDYFRLVDGKDVTAEDPFMAQFMCEVAGTVRAIRSDWLIFAEVDPFAALAGGHGFPPGLPEGVVNASHWYDLAALVTKSYDPERSVDLLSGRPLLGAQAIEDNYVERLSALRAIGDALPGGAPTLIGEFGLPFDLDEATAYRRWAQGDRGPEPWANHVQALTTMYNALDRLLLSSTQWNYTVSNRNDPAVGDGWNQEDLSIWSADQMQEGHDGSRAVEGFSRPYVRRTPGRLISQRFDVAERRFEAAIITEAELAEPIDICLPGHLYREGQMRVNLSTDAEWSIENNSLIIQLVSGTGIEEFSVEIQFLAR
ncbi:cellulase family glycosylhydrolase [Brevundimonas sp.]|uniref:cellulase family glycosylhydrolase n=1 Tax=Brevundimonas sp. TaxID=1871086 RepID=UPI00286B46AA|nr:cellulase family glycosylhydrolase [Brevundimonas sp.]